MRQVSGVVVWVLGALAGLAGLGGCGPSLSFCDLGQSCPTSLRCDVATGVCVLPEAPDGGADAPDASAGECASPATRACAGGCSSHQTCTSDGLWGPCQPGCDPGLACVGDACACTASSCPGCCRGGACLAGGDPLACGLLGQACATCDPQRSDACDARGRCACGSAAACSAGQRCLDHRCVCDDTSCPSGCCAGTPGTDVACAPGTSDTQCGANGQTCFNTTASCTSNCGCNFKEMCVCSPGGGQCVDHALFCPANPCAKRC
jgi:hypothetical protein